MSLKPLVALLLAIPALAGCLSDASIIVDTRTETLYLDAFGDLAEQKAEPLATTPLEWGWTEWLQGALPPSWSSLPFEENRVVESANVTIQYSSEQQLVHTETRPPFTIWFGVGDSLLGNSIIEHAFSAGPNPWDGSTQIITFEVNDLPLGGLTVLAGQRLILYVGSYYADGSETGFVNVELAGSFVEYTHSAFEFPGGSFGENQSFQAQLQGGLCAAGVDIDGSASAEFSVDVPSEAGGLIVRVFNQGGLGIGPDVDFGIRDAEGTMVAHAAGPAGEEGIYLYGPNLVQAAPGAWTIEVYNCQHQVTDVLVQAQVFWPQN